MMKYTVLVAGAVGGAEKRFCDIFKAQFDKGMPARLVLTSGLCKLLFSEIEIKKYKAGLQIIPLAKWNPLLFLIKYFCWMLRNSKKGDQFHYPLNALFFLHIFPYRKFTMSLCDSRRFSLPPFRFRHDIVDYLAMHFASKIDVLSPHVYEKVSASKFSSKTSSTPHGTFVYHAQQIVVPPKVRNIAFIGRLEKDKGLDIFLDIVRQGLKTNFFKKYDSTFQIFGLGSLAPIIQEEVQELTGAGARIAWLGYQEVSFALSSNLIVCSLQNITNYPSRVVAEALLEGRSVIVSETGNSRLFGLNPGIDYVIPDAVQILQVIEEILQDSSRTRQDFMQKVSEMAHARFCNSDYLLYFWNLGL